MEIKGVEITGVEFTTEYQNCELENCKFNKYKICQSAIILPGKMCYQPKEFIPEGDK